MKPAPPPDYLAGYPEDLVAPVRRLIAEQRLGDALLRKYPEIHEVRSDGALYDYVQGLRSQYLRNGAQISKVAFDSKMHVLRNALGTHTTIARQQGSKLKAKREIRIATVFREMPPQFLRMIVVHELAHLKESGHDRHFYQLCRHMEPAYHALEFDTRAYLSHLASGGAALWVPAIDSV